MTARERYHATMHYLPRDRAPIMDFGFWDETPAVWQQQGLPEGVHTDDFFGMDPQWIDLPLNLGLSPHFGERVLEDRGETEIVMNCDGVTVERGKFMGSIPKHLDHALKGRETWERDFKWRLDGRNRFSDLQSRPGMADVLAKHADPNRDYPLGIPAGSLYGWLRLWMGVENISLLVHDDPALFEEMVETVANCIIDGLTPALESGLTFDYALMWEDMAYRCGPLLSPRMFKQYLVPRYRRITELLLKHGVDIVLVDCDGDISLLAPLWLEAGVNTMFPMEVGVWGADPVAYRRKYGKDMRIVGGIGKVLLATTRDAIRKEVERLTPLVEEGGFIPTPDHRVPPDVPFDNYLYYLECARELWG
ncbi:MAG TPA: uroporphyrinogen decarboxylase family protein, partial [Armatimonadota bacterium]|nr:uroporphyrinogen decarboxylase family protein [Armatimonadota bacterium]